MGERLRKAATVVLVVLTLPILGAAQAPGGDLPISKPAFDAVAVIWSLVGLASLWQRILVFLGKARPESERADAGKLDEIVKVLTEIRSDLEHHMSTLATREDLNAVAEKNRHDARNQLTDIYVLLQEHDTWERALRGQEPRRRP